jgi:hypothetical protein
MVPLLSRPDENIFVLDSLAKVPYLWANLAEKTCRYWRKLESVSLHLSLSTGYHLLDVRFITSLTPVCAQLEADTMKQKVIRLTRTHKTQLHFISVNF